MDRTDRVKENLSNELAHSTCSLDLSLSFLAEKLSPNNDGGGGACSLAKNLEVTSLSHVNNGGGSGVSGLLLLLRQKRPQAINVDHRAVVGVLLIAKMTHTYLTEVTRMVFVKQNTVVVLTSSVTATTGVLPVLSNATVAGADVSALLPVLPKAGCHFSSTRERSPM